MRVKFQKVKTEHNILSEFTKFLLEVEKDPNIDRIIPGRISRQQKGSSQLMFRITIPTNSGFKCIMSKGSTAQELFVICTPENIEKVKKNILLNVEKYLIKS
ncbi:MAG TPA: DUF2103 domain-containing protein [Candidatus Absconditabacterales bacterium]|jgi:hypothetical protein|nr:DUF2103 domain-containing protein [Candidatus Absconditabacterales bacterium]HOQ78686.1 DUF2103 domain-containing protein [Candidatus Absconditabacterales bacterium]HPC34173.1 DUF2103 domain-containing protein [Candidatus Absconditabacterales bacterium]HPK27991.1 DUF2103 domain-containing protein [Candidatus Absconditabacterales bacterium]HRU49958.1 DUF2103 domain-containing protein [Candidatus Absconditabacterales bacterium]